jgi:hypothetical protein
LWCRWTGSHRTTGLSQIWLQIGQRGKFTEYYYGETLELIV